MEEKNYNISLFKPNSEFSKVNNRLIITLVIIWAVAIYGFHIFMKIIEKPVPEEALGIYNKHSKNIVEGTATLEQKQQYAHALLSVCGKRLVSANERIVLNKAVSQVVFDIVPEKKEFIKSKVNDFKQRKSDIAILEMEAFKTKREEIAIDEEKFLASFVCDLGLKTTGLRAKLLPNVLVTDGSEEISEASLTSIMNKYLVHNRSFITDTVFLGFPFHYFYTAVFLLMLFVFLCWLYAYKMERINKRFGIED